MRGMVEKTAALAELLEPSSTLLNSHVRKWKDQGGKVVGYFCSYVPEEIIAAAGILPFRMRATGSTETSLADTCLSAYNCSFTRHCLDLAFNDAYDFLDGVVVINSCDHVRRLYDIWRRKMRTPFVHLMAAPHMAGDEQVGWFRDELAILKKALEEHFGVTITAERLRESIRIQNETRQLQKDLYALRKAPSPPITGADTLGVVVASTAMEKERYNELVRSLLAELDGRNGDSSYRARLMLVGGILDDPAYVNVIEELGGLVVIDALCFGTGIFWDQVDEQAEDPMEAMARYYLRERIPCARMVGEHSRRLKFTREMLDTFKVDGVVFQRLKFCDLWGGEIYMLRRGLREAGVPVLSLEREYVLSGLGQLRTRVQAFLESIAR
ncbi:MAG: 2-hydroxyacyl-CoA dehydratase [Anaerolineales bacterium]|nr:MAG: 2-hydroxyacyl-CoA dehydratase [Anaerolineales bacterium]